MATIVDDKAVAVAGHVMEVEFPAKGAGSSVQTIVSDDRVSPLRVLLMISSLERGGAERQVVHLVNTLDPARFDVRVCSLSEQTPLAYNLVEPERLIVLPKRGRFDWRLIGRAVQLMRSLRTQVVHAFLFDAEVVARLAASAAHVPVVIASERNAGYVPPLLHRCADFMTRHRVDFLVANSEAGALFRRHVMPFDTDRIRVVTNGVETSRFRPMDKQAAKRALGFAADDRIIGMVATFKHQKNHTDFFYAASRLASRWPTLRFACVGEAMRDNQQGSEDYHAEMRTLMRSLQLEGRVRLLGERDDMVRVYNALDVMVLPSLHEGTPNVVLESMACGTPVVVNDIADHRQIIRDGVTGYVVRVHDVEQLTNRIEKLIQDEPARHDMGEQARSSVEQSHSLRNMAFKMGTVYTEAFHRKAKVLNGC